MFSTKLDSGYNKYPNLSSLDSLLYIGIKLSTRSIFKIYFERIFEVCFERILRVYFISTYQIQCIFERAKNQFTRTVFLFFNQNSLWRYHISKWRVQNTSSIVLKEGMCVCVCVYIYIMHLRASEKPIHSRSFLFFNQNSLWRYHISEWRVYKGKDSKNVMPGAKFNQHVGS